MATPEQRKLMTQVEELGYTYKGRGGNNDIVMYHPVGGALRIHTGGMMETALGILVFLISIGALIGAWGAMKDS